jgi:hypothetical protein
MVPGSSTGGAGSARRDSFTGADLGLSWAATVAASIGVNAA